MKTVIFNLLQFLSALNSGSPDLRAMLIVRQNEEMRVHYVVPAARGSETVRFAKCGGKVDGYSRESDSRLVRPVLGEEENPVNAARKRVRALEIDLNGRVRIGQIDLIKLRITKILCIN